VILSCFLTLPFKLVDIVAVFIRKRTNWIERKHSSSTRWAAVGFPPKTEKKRALAPGQVADLAVLSGDYFSILEEEIIPPKRPMKTKNYYVFTTDESNRRKELHKRR
jgi:hypothetical protein